MTADPITQRHAPAQVTTSAGRILEFDLATMTDDARASWLAVYELGARDGWQRGYQAALDDDAARWAQMRDHLRAIANRATFGEVEDTRAARLREWLAGGKQEWLDRGAREAHARSVKARQVGA